jgi:hypothetical protein
MPDDAAFTDPLERIDARDPSQVVAMLEEAASANFDAACREGGVDVAPCRGTLIATGDLHDNPLHFARVVRQARLDSDDPRRVILHEVIHSDRLIGDIDMSHRALLRVAALKAQHPERVHTLLANHELSQIVGSGIVKDGVRVVDAFNAGVVQAFGADADRVQEAIGAFIRSMPLALIAREGGRGVLCAHSLPGPEVMERFDPGVLDRPLEEADYEPRQGSAHLMVWGRGHKPEQLERLAATWGVSLFVLGHQKADTGAMVMPPNAIVLNSDHERGVSLPIDLADLPTAEEAAWMTTPLAMG